MTQQKVLVIDDDTSLLKLLTRALEKTGYEVSVASSGADGLKKMYTEQPDIVVLDVMMPAMDGWQVCRQIRDLSDVPVIMLTAKGDVKDKVKGFKLGVDDYVTKPFSFAELIARAGAVLHRSGKDSSARKPTVYSGRGIVIDIQAHRVYAREESIELTPTEFRLLVALAEARGHPVSSETLVATVWGSVYAGETEHVKRYIWRLRRKLEQDAENPRLIVSERGVGYRLVLEEDSAD
ncbi:MAG: response regulator transcription factor [Dehalococcoidia bacterium]